MTHSLRIILLVTSLFLTQGVAAYSHHQSPIHWLDYSDTALTRAATENKPIFMLISAVWCFNCHIYEATLNTATVAEAINRDYIAIFVDYDRRADVAREYPSVGIPLTVILAPNGEHLVSVPGAIEQQRLLSSLEKTLIFLAEEYQPEQGDRTTEAHVNAPLPLTRAQLRHQLEQFNQRLFAELDPIYGGFGRAQKEPKAETLLQLLAMEQKGDKKWRAPLQTTLDAIIGSTKPLVAPARPDFETLLQLREQQTLLLEEIEQLQKQDKLFGLFDPIEGGFFRYASHRDWSAPHFEKLLLENAQLIELMLKASVQFQQPRYSDAAKQSLHFLLTHFFDNKTGQFFGSLQADAVYYHLTENERTKVAPPSVDQTSYAVPSARALMTLLLASRLLDQPEYLSQATKAADFIISHMIGEQGSYSYFDSKQSMPRRYGQLSDNAWLAEALLMTYEATKSPRYLDSAEEILSFTTTNLYDSKLGGFFTQHSEPPNTDRDSKNIPRDKDWEGNGQMAKALHRAFKVTGKKKYLTMLKTTASYFFSAGTKIELNSGSASWHEVAELLLTSGLLLTSEQLPTSER